MTVAVMKGSLHTLIRLLGAFLLSAACYQWATAQNPTTLAPQAYMVILDNDKVRVIDYRLKPGEREPMHSHPSGVLVYYFTDAKMRVTTADRAIADSHNSPGDIVWRDPVTHFAENTADTEAHALLIEPKVSCKVRADPLGVAQSRSPGQREGMPMQREPHHHLRFQNQHLRVFEVTLNPSESSLFHRHALDVVYFALADGTAKPQLQGENAGTEINFRMGEATFDEASLKPFTHRLTNVGKTQFHTLNIELCPESVP